MEQSWTPHKLRDRLLHGAFWVTVAQIATQGFQFAAVLVLARLLAPCDFGLFAMCYVVVGIATIVIEIGLPNALIQADTLTPTQLSSATWVNTSLGAAIAVGVFFFGQPLAVAFHQPGLAPFVRVLAAEFVILGLGVTPDAILRREMRFREVAAADVARALVTSSVAITAAICGSGVWALVAGELAGAGTRVVILGFATKGRCYGRFVPRSLQPLLSFGLNNTGASFCHSIRQQLDTLIVGRVLGAAALGGYNLVTRIVTTPQKRVSWVLMKVCFPGFSRINSDADAFRRVYLKVISVTAFLSFPFLAYIFGNAEAVVPVVFGPGWAFVIMPLRVFCFAGAAISVLTLAGPVLLARGRAALDFKLAIMAVVVLAAAVGIGSRFDLVGVSVGFLVYTVVAGGVMVFFVNRVIGLRHAQFVRVLASGTATAVAIGITSFTVGHIAYEHAGPFASVIVSAAAAALVYGGAAFVLRRNDVSAAGSFLRERFRGFANGYASRGGPLRVAAKRVI